MMLLFPGERGSMLTRRAFLSLPLALALSPLARARGETANRTATYEVDVGILYHLLSFHLTGTIAESIDRSRWRYEVHVEGQGSGIMNRTDSRGVWRDGRWAPTRTQSLIVVYGRESRLDVAYDYAARTVDYRSRAETFFLRRLRVAEDVLRIPDGMHVDDALSATLNYAEGLWSPRADGAFETHVVRRRRPPTEGADDVEKRYYAELVPLVLKVAADPETGKPTALFDLSRFSSWAREDRPARIVFGPDRRPQAITSSLMLGTGVRLSILYNLVAAIAGLTEV